MGKLVKSFFRIELNYIFKNIIIICLLSLFAVLVFNKFSFAGLISLIFALIVSEFVIYKLVNKIRIHFQWLITFSKDKFPIIDKHGLKKFMEHGFDPEFGWIRKPNTEHEENGKFGKTNWHTNDVGARLNPGFENIPSAISCFGDSFTFSRQVNDNETWPNKLSALCNTNVLNRGIGNHGLDQAYLLMKREIPKHPTPVVIMGVVPDTISRILSRWKHFYEYGNTFAFKPAFHLIKGNLVLLPNLGVTEENIINYKEKYREITESDFFYSRKFCDEIFSFPYFFSFFRNI